MDIVDLDLCQIFAHYWRIRASLTQANQDVPRPTQTNQDEVHLARLAESRLDKPSGTQMNRGEGRQS